MKILIFSDSHGCIETMEAAVRRELPHMMVHLGDFWADGKQLHSLFPQIPMCQVAGNCDRYRWEPVQDQILIRPVGGVLLHDPWPSSRSEAGPLRLRLAAEEAGPRLSCLVTHTEAFVSSRTAFCW